MQKPYSQSLLTYGRNKLFWQLGHTVTRVCQRSLHFHESFISYFSFFKKSCMKLICYWFETYYLLQLCRELFLEDNTVQSIYAFFSVTMRFVKRFQKNQKNLGETSKVCIGYFQLFPTILSAIFSGLTDLNSSLARQSLLMSTLPVNEFITVFTTSVILCIPSGW